jgi:hypothetical protein
MHHAMTGLPGPEHPAERRRSLSPPLRIVRALPCACLRLPITGMSAWGRRGCNWRRAVHAKSGLTFTELGLGTAPLAGLYRPVPQAEAGTVMDAAWAGRRRALRHGAALRAGAGGDAAQPVPQGQAARRLRAGEQGRALARATTPEGREGHGQVVRRALARGGLRLLLRRGDAVAGVLARAAGRGPDRHPPRPRPRRLDPRARRRRWTAGSGSSCRAGTGRCTSCGRRA